MAGSVLKHGRPTSAPEADIGWIDGYQRACVYDAHGGWVIVYALGGWIGEWSGGTPYARLVMANVGGGDTPGAILAQTAEFQPSAWYGDVSGGAAYERSVTPFVHGPERFSLALTSRNGAVAHSMRQAQYIGASNRNFYDKVVSGGNPTNPLGGSPSYEGHASLWFVAEPSVKPNAPGSLTPTGGSASTTLTPTLTSTFSDANETLNNGAAFDYLNRYQVLVERVSDGAVMWNQTFTASGTERTNRATSRAYAGSTLAYNTTYRYRIRHEDRTGLWSDWSQTTFSVTSLSSVDTPTNPAGFETSLTAPGNITAVYRHNAGLSANGMQARLLSSSGSVIATSAIKAVTVSPNGTLSMTWAESGFGAHVAHGGVYGVEVRARDTNNLWSPSWSPVSAFRFNAAPGIPTNLSPTGSQAKSTRPLLTAVATDPDPEHPSSALTVKARIKNNAGTVLQTRTMLWNAATGRFEYQTISADLAAYGTFRWDAYAYDGYLYSGGTTTEASAAKSAESVFVYAAGPSVTVTGPASPIATTTPTISWTTAQQAGYRVRLFRADDSLAYDTGYQNGNISTHVIAPGNWIGGEKWNTGETFDVVVSVTDFNLLTGDSAPYPVQLVFAPPAALATQAHLHTLPGMDVPAAIRLEHEQSSYPSNEFLAYVYTRVELLPDGVTERAGSAVTLATVDDVTQTILLDAEVTSGQLYRYGVYQRVMQGNDILDGVVTTVVQSVTWDGVMLHMPYDPDGRCVHLRYGPANGEWAPALRLGQTSRLESPVGRTGRVAFFAPGTTHDPSGEFGLITDDASTADDKYTALVVMYEAQNGDLDGRPHIIAWRDGRGGPHGRLYGKIDDIERTHGRAGSWNVTVAFSEVAFDLGVAS